MLACRVSMKPTERSGVSPITHVRLIDPTKKLEVPPIKSIRYHQTKKEQRKLLTGPTASAESVIIIRSTKIAGCAVTFFCHTTGSPLTYTLDLVERPQKARVLFNQQRITDSSRAKPYFFLSISDCLKVLNSLYSP